jgi:predicted branched-subunit amino acid permease
MSDRHAEFVGQMCQGLIAFAPLAIGVLPFGMVSGVTAVSVGLSPTEAMAMAVGIYSGAAQLAIVGLWGKGAAGWVALLTAGLVSLRFAMYSASIAPFLRRSPRPWRLLAAYLLTDQAYALAIARFGVPNPITTTQGANPASEATDAGIPPPITAPGERSQWQRLGYFLGAGLGMWLAWEIGSAVGIVLGAKIPARWQLDFAIPLVFLGLLRPSVRDRPAVAAMLASGTVAVLAHAWPHNLGMVAAACTGIAVGLTSEGRRPFPK